MIPKTVFALALSLFIFTAAFSQKREAEKWGNITAADLAMTVYPEDSAAGAVILQDVGSVRLQDIREYLVVFKQHRRIKVKAVLGSRFVALGIHLDLNRHVRAACSRS